MASNRPETIALRAVNQYRNRDIFAYLSLRYYVENLSARTDHWANNAAVDLILSRTKGTYFKAYHFKEIEESGEVHHRNIYIPTATESLAEIALLSECAKFDAFSNNGNCVFSYPLEKESSKSGIFRHYIHGLRERQIAISNACEEISDGYILHTDIKKFYPSISLDIARHAWKERCEASNMNGKFRLLGEKLISGYADIEGNNALIIGPMFCHFLSNMVLWNLDLELSSTLPARYFRYVDDITLVGKKSHIDESLTIIKSRLASLGLQLHDNSSTKHMECRTSEWMQFKNDFHDSNQAISWKTLVGDLKKFLLINHDQKELLKYELIEQGYRLPLYDYTVAVHDTSYIDKIRAIAINVRSRYRMRKINISSLLSQCEYLRSKYYFEINSLIESLDQTNKFERKSKITKIRYRISRLLYLATKDQLSIIHESLCRIPELHFHSAIIKSIITKNIDEVISLGINCAQATCQIIKSENGVVHTTFNTFTEVQAQSLSVFKIHQIEVKGDFDINSDLFNFASNGCDESLIQCSDAFIKEIACLHGFQLSPRHREILDTVFDRDENLTFDAVDQLQESLSL